MHRRQQVLTALALLVLGGVVVSIGLAALRPGSKLGSLPRQQDVSRTSNSRRPYLGVNNNQQDRLLNVSEVLPAEDTASLKPNARCQGTLGTWCEEFLTQSVALVKPPTEYGKLCDDPTCNSAGVCNAETGICSCTAGWKGPNCEVVQKRPCTWGHRQSGSIPLGAPPNSSVIGWTGSRCAGRCDEDVATCYCNGTQSHRPMVERQCFPSKDDFGNPSEGWVEPDLLYGKKGWCSAKQPAHLCQCIVEHLGGPLCEVPIEMMCLNACNGHGDCMSGFCMCHAGYFGHDCSRRVKGSKPSTGLQRNKPWLRSLIVDPPAANATRKVADRPLIYVYDLPVDYNARLLQYRVHGMNCVHRTFNERNRTRFTHFTYGIEVAFHEMLLQSNHRTLNPEEADFFYVPVYSSCLVQPVLGFADHPWYYGPGGPRVMHAAAMLLEAKRWIQENHPFWNRSKGEDHIWLITQDEGSCWAPAEIRSSIILSHWGRKDTAEDPAKLPPQSATSYTYDSYSEEFVHPEYSPQGWTRIIKGHPCYDPKKDLIIPSFRAPDLLLESPLLGFPPKERNILLFFRGKIWDETPFYSRGIRQRIFSLSKQRGWYERHKIVIGEDVPGDYSWLMASSKFCLAAPGAGWSSRAEEAILHGCIPVVVQDNVDPVFATALRWQDFALRVAEADVDLLPQILENISPTQILLMQEALGMVWHRLAYSSMPAFQQAIRPYLEHNRNARQPPASLPEPQYGDLVQDDAFATIMQWLYGRIRLRQSVAQSI